MAQCERRYQQPRFGAFHRNGCWWALRVFGTMVVSFAEQHYAAPTTDSPESDCFFG